MPAPFSGNHSVTFSQGRRGEVYVYQGYGNRGRVYSPSLNAWRDVGLAAPSVAPTITASATNRYYVARIDLTENGRAYTLPPQVTISGGSPTTAATATARLREGYVSAIDVTNYGKGYQSAPVVSVTDPQLANTNTAGGSTITAVQLTADQATWSPIVRATATASVLAGAVDNITVVAGGGPYAYPPKVSFSGGGGTGAEATAVLTNGVVTAVTITNGGSGYATAPTVTIALPNPGTIQVSSDRPVTIEGLPAGDIPSGGSVSVSGFFIENTGNYTITLKMNTANASVPEANQLDHPTFTTVRLAPANITGGVRAVLALDYRATKTVSPPAITTPYRWYANTTTSTVGGLIPGSSNAAAGVATPIMRAHLRGKYQCYYRYVNDAVPTAEGGPIYSSLSPVTEIDCGDGTQSVTWTYTAAPAGMSVELWRSTSNQATTLFRVAKIGGTGAFGSTTDSLTDWELVDPDRAGFQAMPVLLPNGELNANRFGVPPTDLAVGVMFQDRLWMGVDTSGTKPNSLRFSEVDEPESMPDVNEIILQTNLRDTDYVTALIPYAGALIVGQSRHCYRLTYVAQPLVDIGAYMLAYRGVYNQRCWDIYDGKIYAMDDQGVYSLDTQGNVEDLSLGIFDFWVNRIDSTLRKWFYVRADKRLGVLRVGVAAEGDGSSKFTSRQFVYSFDFKTWWEERYPAELTSAAEVRTSDGGVRLVFGTSGNNLRHLGTGLVDLAEGSVSGVTITNPGRGYRQPPVITATGGHGAEFECALNSDGSITGIVVKYPGTKYPGGNLVIAAPAAGGTQATATYAVSSGSRPVHWSFKSGCFEYTTDSQDKRGGEAQNRQCSVTYQPTANQCLLNLKAYYNNAKYPRSNVVRRDRGSGFVHSDQVPAAVLDMQASPLQEAEAHGVARALFAGRVLDDMMGADRHVSIALSGQQDSSGPVAIHNLDIYGVNDKAGG
jgi:hypothetical protein